MARILLNIEADSPQDYYETLRGLAYPDAPVTIPSAEHPEAGATQDAEPGESQRRTRRTKAQIEADALAAAQVRITSGSATDVSTASAAATPGPSKSSQPSENGAAERPTPPTSDASPASLSDVRNVMQAFLARDGKDAADIQAVFHLFVTGEGDQVERASQLQASDYAAFIEKLAA